MYRALDIAHYIIQRCNTTNRTISNLKLQKILYFVQAEFLVTKNQPCFVEEIQAWILARLCQMFIISIECLEVRIYRVLEKTERLKLYLWVIKKFWMEL